MEMSPNCFPGLFIYPLTAELVETLLTLVKVLLYYLICRCQGVASLQGQQDGEPLSWYFIIIIIILLTFSCPDLLLGMFAPGHSAEVQGGRGCLTRVVTRT